MILYLTEFWLPLARLTQHEDCPSDYYCFMLVRTICPLPGRARVWRWIDTPFRYSLAEGLHGDDLYPNRKIYTHNLQPDHLFQARMQEDHRTNEKNEEHKF